MKAFMVTDENGEQTVVIAADWWDALNCYVAEASEMTGGDKTEIASAIDCVALLSNSTMVSWIALPAFLSDEPSPKRVEPNG